MIKRAVLIFLMIFCVESLFSADLFMYKYNNEVIYAAAIQKINNIEGEYIVGLLEINTSGDEWWTISTHSYIDKDFNIISKIDLNFPTLRFNGPYLDAQINSRNNTILHMEKVETILYKGCDIKLPDIFNQQ